MVSGIGQGNNNWDYYSLIRQGNSSSQLQGQGYGQTNEAEQVSAVNLGINGVSSSTGTVSAQSSNTNESLVSRLDSVQGELSPDTRNASQGQNLYFMA